MEIEIKLAASPEVLHKLRDHPLLAAPGRTATHSSTYFDTIGGRLSLACASLRVREKKGRREQTLKLPSTRGLERSEWNIPIEGREPDLAAFPPRARAAVARIIGKAPIRPFARVCVEREVRQVIHGNSLIEIAFDCGTIAATTEADAAIPTIGRIEPVCELELELIRGNLSDVLALASRLPLGPGLGWSVAGKGERAHALAYDRTPQPAHASPPALTRRMNAARAFQAIGWNCLGQLLANAPLIETADDAEALHQARVAIRRLRAAFSLFNPVIGKAGEAPETDRMRQALREAAAAMGPARDLHVLRERLEADGVEGDEEGSRLIDLIVTREVEEMERVRAMLEGEPFRRLAMELALWLEKDGWLDGPAAAGTQPLPVFAAHVLDRRRGRLRGRRKHLSVMPDADLHQLRIEVKKLRYACGFFEPILAGEAARQAHAHGKILGRLQDVLGELHDLAVARQGGEQGVGRLLAGNDAALAARLDRRLARALDHVSHSRKALIEEARHLLAQEKHCACWWHQEAHAHG